tara:strand:+ start:2195 stop:2347 length:153 start_codon:yes stop_codon:yes gene_type:complete
MAKRLIGKDDFKEYIKLLNKDIKRLKKKLDLKDKEIKQLKDDAKDLLLYP